jgi:CheY-like chemotaxis protein
MLKTLIVEDKAIFRREFRAFLVHRYPFMCIEEAGDAEEAMVKVNEWAPDLIFMDVQLPGVNGIELTQRIMARHPKMTIVVLTTFDIPEYRISALASGARHFLPKTAVAGPRFAETMEAICLELGLCNDRPRCHFEGLEPAVLPEEGCEMSGEPSARPGWRGRGDSQCEPLKDAGASRVAELKKNGTQGDRKKGGESTRHDWLEQV